MQTQHKIKSCLLLVIMTMNMLPSSVYAIDFYFGNNVYEDDYLFNYIHQSEDDSDDSFGSDDIDFNAALEDPEEDFSDIFGDLLGDVEEIDEAEEADQIEDLVEAEEDFSDIFGDLLGDVEEMEEVEDDSEVEEDISDIFGDLLGDVEEMEEVDEEAEIEEDFADFFRGLLGEVEDEETSTNVIQQQYPNCQAIDDMVYGYSVIHVSKFIDIEESLYKNDIIRVENAGVIDGRSENTFDPYENITRAEFLSVAMKAHCIDFSEEGTHDFIDVESSGWKARVVSKAISEEIISGATNDIGQKIFRPNDPITRMEVLAILLNMTKREIPWDRESPYIDIASQQWQKNYVTRWNELGLFMPYKTHNQFYPNRYVMREHIGSILYSVVELYR